jgi:glycosyltransferase involved in cell wall biosynthesis
MNSGIILVFKNDEHNINVEDIVEVLNGNTFKICFVNNGSTDNTSKLLSRIKFQSNANSDIFILDNKHDKGLKYAVKAGARFLLNETEFDRIIYLESNIAMYLKDITEYFVQLASQKENLTTYPTRSQRNVLRDVFSFRELLKMNNTLN